MTISVSEMRGRIATALRLIKAGDMTAAYQELYYIPKLADRMVAYGRVLSHLAEQRSPEKYIAFRRFIQDSNLLTKFGGCMKDEGT